MAWYNMPNRGGSVVAASGGGGGAKASSLIPFFLNKYEWLVTVGERCYSATNKKTIDDQNNSKGKFKSLTFSKDHMQVICTFCKEYGNAGCEWSAFKLKASTIGHIILLKLFSNIFRG